MEETSLNAVLHWFLKDKIPFWGVLDSIGLSAYDSLTNQNDPSVSQLLAGWTKWEPAIEALHKKYGKEILFTEIGYRSLAGANIAPWDYLAQGPQDRYEQNNDYIALFQYWSQFS